MPVPDVSQHTLAELVSLTGRRAVVTGGARGLGKAIALRLAEAGADVVIGDLDEDLAVRTAAELAETHGVRAEGHRLDVASTDSVVALADATVEHLGGIDIWVNNAGIFPNTPLLELSDEQWDQVFAVNARGALVGAREAARRMTAAGSGGVIVNVVSTAGFRGTGPGLAAYVGSKHAVRGLTRQLALELAPQGIRVLGVAPSYVPTEGNQAMLAAALEALGQPLGGPSVDAPPVEYMATPLLGRVGTPDDIARVALFAASDLSAFMTGSTLLADGGETA
ncbi:SDR family NAD(P)-dependent oxidoreductase [Herbiconiux sp. VKM Ac-2851]|uniref:SDR family NAD(P)-dependent oxidoreductase n=1 Tax=Herbiconiux sp. VKM Ac-2851 TaxID=2739025 RepID=UPI001564A1B4|nr:SDR family oxidoreductase [Herbiconiux sp. VKM Ac-2851]NQX34518.1 SDR family oxidoreductase [Herbiconiux sp. VKM Ac-2851]